MCPHIQNQPGKSEPNQPDELYLNQTEKPSDNTYQLSGKSEPNQQFQKPLLNELTKPLKNSFQQFPKLQDAYD